MKSSTNLLTKERTWRFFFGLNKQAVHLDKVDALVTSLRRYSLMLLAETCLQEVYYAPADGIYLFVFFLRVGLLGHVLPDSRYFGFRV